MATDKLTFILKTKIYCSHASGALAVTCHPPASRQHTTH